MPAERAPHFLLNTGEKIFYIAYVREKSEEISSEQLTQIQNIVDSEPDISRRELSRRVCKLLDWRSPNGDLKEMHCRTVLLKLHRRGQLELPQVKLFSNSPSSPADAFEAPLGQTKGRGRQDRHNACSVKIKDIYVFPLHQAACNILNAGSCIHPNPSRRPAIDWVEEEFFRLDLGDQRSNVRLMTIVRDFYARPQANIPQASQTRDKTKAAYRFIDQDTHTILAPHIQSTVERMQTEKVILAAQDTSSLNYSTHPATENLGPISTQKDSVIGLLLHDTMAFNEEGTPVGLLDAQCRARNPDDFGKKQRRHQTPIEQKESHKWLKSYQSVRAAQKQCPNTFVVSVGDREADIYELFDMALGQTGDAKLLVRANHDRLLAEGYEKLGSNLQNQPVSGIQQIHVPRQGKRKARTASLEIRFAQVVLKPPLKKKGLKPLTVWAVLAQEINCPDDVNESLKWMLLTTIEVTTFEQAIEKLAWYAGRSGIEVYHRTLKSGCKIEERQLGCADRIETCLAIDMVIAWRVFHLTKLGREVPDVPCAVFFEEAEWKALVAYKTQNPVPPEKVPTLREAVQMVGSLGGHLGRKSDGEPGTKALWLGLRRLDDMKSMWEIMQQQTVSKNKSSPGVQYPRYG